MSSTTVNIRKSVSFPIGEQLYNISLDKVKAVIDETFMLHQGEFRVKSCQLEECYKFHPEEAYELARILDDFHNFCADYITRTYGMYYSVDVGCMVGDSKVWFYWDKLKPVASDCHTEHLR